MKSTRTFLLVSLLFACIYAFADDPYINNSTSAQVEGMIRYGDIETSLYTGTLHFSALLFALKDPDFNLNITLSYNSDGFKPLKNSGYVGYNWSLLAGGCVTREVKGYADETCRLVNPTGTSSESSYAKGMYFYTYTNSQPQREVDVDGLPDIWHFNFLGYNGKFMINNDGHVKIISGDYVDVDLSKTIDESAMKIVGTCPLQSNDTSQITIKTKDGYTYVFGGQLSALEFTYALKNGDTEIDQFPPVVSTWHLSKVIAPNGRTITYYYKGYGNEKYHVKNCKNLRVFKMYYSFFEFKDWHEEYKWARPNNVTAIQSPYTHNGVKYCYTKECVLDSIHISGEIPLRVHFLNSVKSRRSGGPHTQCYGNYMLDTIHVFSKDILIQSTHLTYQNITNKNEMFHWYLLKNVTIDNKGEYTFAYDTVNGIIPAILAENNSSYFNLVDLYGYGKNCCHIATLSEVHFPTGGYQRYQYEEHDFSTERRWKTMTSNYDVRLLSHDVNLLKTSGVRITRTETYDDANCIIEKRDYSYRRQEANNLSSGVLFDNLLVSFSEFGDNWMAGASENYSFFDTHIGYSYVEEYAKDSNNMNLFRNTYSFDIGTEYYCNETITTSKYSLFSGILTFDSGIYTKGKLLCRKFYNGQHLQKSIQHIYNTPSYPTTDLFPIDTNSLGCIDTFTVFSRYAGDTTLRKLYIYPDVMKQEIISDYVRDDSVPLVIIHSYLYDCKLRMKKEVIKDSHNVQRFTKYTYPDELCSMGLFAPNPVFFLVQSNRINTPIETVSGYIENETEYVTTGTINQYANNTFVVVDSINQDFANLYHRPYLSQTLSLSLKQPITNYQPISILSGQFLYDEHYKLTCEYKYDLMDRLLSVKPFGKQETRYTWNDIYPIMKTIGNQTWTYTYKPHIGLETMTDPRGITTCYTYDSAGRLIREYQLINGNKQILNAYHYHIKTE